MPKLAISPHESIELHEILTFKNICLTKSITMSTLVSDNELKGILQQDVVTTERQIRELKGLLEQADDSGNIIVNPSTLS